MKHQDLGRIDGPVLLFGGAYSNVQALEALIGEAENLGIGADRMICTGDVVAYCGAPRRTVDVIQRLGCAVVAGNCEIQLAEGRADCGCGFEEGSQCDLLSASWYGYAQNALDQQANDWMGGLPDVVSFHHNGQRYGVLHGGISDVARFIWSSSPEDVFAQEWELLSDAIGPVDHIIAGHSGIPFVRQTSDGRWINAGVIGMPPHDGHRQTRFALLEHGRVQIRSLSYDHDQAAQDMRQAGLPEGYRRGLLTGYWPSEDVLPSDLRSAAVAKG